MLIPVMTVAENIVLATEPVKDVRPARLRRGGEARAARSRRRFGLAVDPRAQVEDITVGQQQRVEILKALYRGADILVLDEPTAVLTPQEAQELFAIIRSLTEQGKSIIFISHKLNEVIEIADRITVLRRGKKIETLPAAGATEESLARLMVGREVLLRVEKGPPHAGRAAARGRGPPRRRRPRDREGARRLASRSAAARSSAIAGVDGNGQTELIDAIAGLRRSNGRQDRRSAARTSPATSREGLARRGPRPHPGGPPAARARARLPPRREPRAPRLRHAARVALRLALPEAAGRAGARRCSREFDVRGGGPQTPRRRRSRAATSRRWSSRARSTATRRC